MVIFLSIVSVVVLVLSVVAHVCSFFPQFHTATGYFWLLHPAALACFAVMGLIGFSLRRLPQVSSPRDPSKKRTAPWVSNWELLERIPCWVLGACMVTVFYAVASFAVLSALASEGCPVEENGSYHLEDHGEVVRELTKEEYQHLEALKVRGFSGLWILFSVLPVVFFKYLHGPMERAAEAFDNEGRVSRI